MSNGTYVCGQCGDTADDERPCDCCCSAGSGPVVSAWRGDPPDACGWYWYRRNGQVTTVFVTPGFFGNFAVQFFGDDSISGLEEVPRGEWQPAEPRP